MSNTVTRARVIVNEPLNVLDYRIPEKLVGSIHPGVPVKVPLGKRTTRGYVAGIEAGPAPDGITLKDIKEIDHERPKVPALLLDLIVFAARYYHAPPGDILSAALPASARVASARYVLTADGEAALSSAKKLDRELLELASRFPKGFTVAVCERDLGWSRRSSTTRLNKHVKLGWLEQMKKRRDGPRRAIAYRAVDPRPSVKLSDAGAELLERISAGQTVLASELAARDRGAYGKLKTLEKNGFIERVEVEQRLKPHGAPDELESRFQPTRTQQEAIDALTAAIDANAFSSFLLEGVTGSGKTEVYLQMIEHTLAAGRNALVLVPEIALTPQLGRRFRARFGDSVATFHSGLTTAERRDEWERVAAGKARIGLGARSALFLPLANVGAIIVDEEHETSFKQEETPRYNARDLAVVRARLENAVAVLGSATPSLETHFNAANQRYVTISMPDRVSSRPMPSVTRIDLKHEDRVGEGVFSKLLHQAIDETLSRDEQTVLFLNRRGFASNVSCEDCGHTFKCPSCDVSLTLHRRRDVLACHYCGYEERTVDECPSCHSHKLDSGGLGTERVQSEVENLLPGAPIVRLDRDTVSTRADLERSLARFGSGEAKILIGTQMVAKGHDFPGVTLVGVLNADAGLNFPDFRAAERTFQLLTQVSGRAGRGEKPGRVMVQTYDPEHYAVRFAARHDYRGFTAEELEWRRELSYPPFTYLALMRFESQSETRALRVGASVAEALRDLKERVEVLGPAPSPIARIKGLWRFQLLIKAHDRQALHRALQKAPRYNDPQTRQILDVDPISML
ncbi:MAG: primosomal protein N' [Myxococcota bacterium]